MKDILKNRNLYMAFSGVIILFSILVLCFAKINLGIDMTGGTQSEYSYTGTIDINKINSSIEEASKDFNTKNSQIINSTSAYTISGEEKIGVVIGFNSLSDEKQNESLKTEFKDKVSEILSSQNQSFNLDNYTNIGKSFGDYVQKTAYITLALGILAISVYLGFAFNHVINGVSSLSFASIVGITLFHDVIIAIGLYIFTGMFFPEFKLDTYSITALLTILGYSINDTIVVFDRIRTNLREFGGRGKDLYEIIDISLNQTFARSLFTSSTVIFVLIALFFFGPETLKGFILVMIYGTVFGTYSSIFISSPILYEVNKNNKIMPYKKIIVRDEDKIVV